MYLNFKKHGPSLSNVPNSFLKEDKDSLESNFKSINAFSKQQKETKEIIQQHQIH